VIVVDASAAAEVLLRGPAAEAIERRIHHISETLHAPHSIDVEVSHVIRRYAARGDISDDLGRGAISDLVDFPVRRHPHLWLLPRIWELRHNLSAYDAAYVALAETLDAPIVTRDRRLAGASGHRARIELI
jgi:predicted nucleic acid-binding protein